MSQTEFERFATALRANPALAEGYRTLPTVAAVAERMRADGYDVSEPEIEQAARLGTAHAASLTDEQLEQVTGGSLLVLGIGAAVMAVAMLPGIAMGLSFAGLQIAKSLGAKID